MNIRTTVADKRTSFRVLAAAINTAATLTVSYIAPNIPDQILIAWGGVFMAAIGFGEAFFDSSEPPTA